MTHMFYYADGTPIDDEADTAAGIKWARYMQELRAKDELHVGKETLSNGRWVSTVFLGLNHNYEEDGPPILYETMVFPAKGAWSELDMERYSTREEARAGHQRMVEKWKHAEAP